MFEELSLKDMATVYNSYARKLQLPEVKRFADSKTALKKLEGIRPQAAGTKIVFVVVPVEASKKRGAAAERYKLYTDLGTTEEYIASCVAAGFSASAAKRDLQHDELKGFIKIV